MQDIRSLKKEELLEFLKENGEAAFRVKQIMEWIWKKNVGSMEDMRNIPAVLREKLCDNFSLEKINVVEEQVSEDKTVKCRLRLYDGHHVEMVVIPSAGRATVCVSTQVGCALKCAFCATGGMGFVRNLTDYEIYEQVFLANNLAGDRYNNKISNIVMMGMGEPLLNFDNVCDGIRWISDKDGLGMSAGRVTVSTVGITGKIRELADRNTGVNLAVSLHTANENKRRELIPAAENNSLNEISRALIYYHAKTNQRVTIEYLLLAGVNDGVDDAEELAVFCRKFPVKVNVIEYNPHKGSRFGRSSREKVEEFVEVLGLKNMVVQVRRSRGKDISAACGQLAIDN